MTAAVLGTEAMVPGDRVAFVRASPLYEAGVRRGTVVSATETVAEFWRREAARYGMAFRQVVARGPARRGRPVTARGMARRLPVVRPDVGGPVQGPGTEIAVEACHLRKIGPVTAARN